jgi:hypothetical protein
VEEKRKLTPEDSLCHRGTDGSGTGLLQNRRYLLFGPSVIRRWLFDQFWQDLTFWTKFLSFLRAKAALDLK